MDRLAAWIFAAVTLGAGSVAYADEGYRLLQIDGRDVKWGAPVLGKGASVTYAIAERPAAIKGNVNCLHVASVKRLFLHSHLTRQIFERELSGAFAMWQSVANVQFHAVTNPSVANIVIASEGVPDGIAYADVSLDASKSGDVSRLTKGIVCLNPSVQWTAKRTDSGEGEQYRLQYTLAHEIGHVLGLDHPSPQGELMSFEYGHKFEGLKQGDIAGIGLLYGRRSPVPALALNGKTAAVR